MTGTDGCCNVPSNLHANLYYQEQDVRNSSMLNRTRSNDALARRRAAAAGHAAGAGGRGGFSKTANRGRPGYKRAL